MSGSVQTAKLDAVNRVLLTMGAPIANTIASSRAAKLVDSTIDQATEDLCNRSWWFNTTINLKIATAASGWIHLPNDVTNLDSDDYGQYHDRDRRFYNKRDRTFEFAIPTNLLTNPDDPSHADWDKDSGDIVVTLDRAQVPAQGVREGHKIDDTDAAGIKKLTQAITGLTDQVIYEYSMYVKVGAGTLLGANFQLQCNHTGGTQIGYHAVDLTDGSTTITGWLYDAETLTLDDSWYFLRGKVKFDVADGSGITFSVVPDAVGSSAANQDVHMWKPQFVVSGTGVFPMCLVHLMEFLDLPTAARQFVLAASARKSHGRLIGTNSRTQELAVDENKAMETLMKAQLKQSDSNQLTDSFSRYRITGRGRYGNPLLHGLEAPYRFSNYTG